MLKAKASSLKEENKFNGVFHRMKRKKNGWVVEELTITPLKMTLVELSDWDVRTMTEHKALMAMVKAAGD